MKTSCANALGASALLGLVLLAFQGCGSSQTQGDADASEASNGSGGTSNASNANSGNSDGNTTGSNEGGADGGTDTSSSGGLECDDPTAWPCNMDPNCNSADAKTDATCTIDCKISCGFDSLGTKLCSCVGGVYSQCPCPRPPEYMGAETAKYCDDPAFPSATETGLMEEMKGNPCETEWEQCIARDVPPGSTPRGCVCMLNLITNELQWYCGSTNKWFFPE